MADQLCGQFYAQLLDCLILYRVTVPRTALRTIYDACFLKFYNGQFGAANGVRPDGSPKTPMLLIPRSLDRNQLWTCGFSNPDGNEVGSVSTHSAVVQQIYENGLQFRTPEAITAAGTFRASHYLRAMAIWAIYGVLNGFQPLIDAKQMFLPFCNIPNIKVVQTKPLLVTDAK